MNIVVSECRGCGNREFVRRRACPRCGGTSFADAAVPGRGTVYASTRIRVAPGAFASDVPYWIVLADLDGVRVVGRLSGSSPAPSIGSPVEVKHAGEHLELEVLE